MTDVNRFVRYYNAQAGAGVPNTFPVYRGSPFQYGYGVGNYAIQEGSGFADFFKSLFRIALPLVKKVGVALGRQSLESGARILEDVSAGNKPIKSVLRSRINEAGDSLLDKASQSADRIMKGGGVKGRVLRRNGHSTVRPKRTTTSVNGSRRTKPAPSRVKTAKKKKPAIRKKTRKLNNKSTGRRIPDLRDIFQD